MLFSTNFNANAFGNVWFVTHSRTTGSIKSGTFVLRACAWQPRRQNSRSPGISLSRTDYESAGDIACDKGPFRDGSPEKIGGWGTVERPGDEVAVYMPLYAVLAGQQLQSVGAFGTYHRLYVFGGDKTR